ncbi:hypothetical protein HNV12_13590 [Methanococcoides sp. SA1]|nr:hypothetical protein [Methanococcoides sp. SA1]
MDFTDIDQIVWFLIFFVPGFVSLKVYDLLIPNVRRDFSKSLFDAIVYSAFNYAFWSWAIVIMYTGNTYTSYPKLHLIFIIFIFLISPIVWPLSYLKVLRWGPIKNRVLHPCPNAWDYVFSKRNEEWVIVHLKDGRTIAGIFSSKSFASSYPAKEQIYLEDIWKLDDNGAFKESLNNSLLVLNDEIMGIEFIHKGDD